MSLTDTMANTLWLFRRNKEDAATLGELRVACDEALQAMRDALDALTRFRRTLDERLSQPGRASELPS